MLAARIGRALVQVEMRRRGVEPAPKMNLVGRRITHSWSCLLISSTLLPQPRH
jgi:hypothetical protein